MKYEYREEYVGMGGTGFVMTNAGNDGWKCLAIIQDPMSPSMVYIYYMREVKEN